MASSLSEDAEPSNGSDIQEALRLLDAKRAYLRFLDSAGNRKIMDREKSGFRDQGIEHTADLEIKSVRSAQNFWVAPDMVALVNGAFETMPDEEVLLEEPPAPHGILLMGQPFTQQCSDPGCGEEHPFIGFHWRPAHRVLPANEHSDEQHDDGLLFTWVAPTSAEERQWMGNTPFSPANSAIFIPAGRQLNTSYSVEIGAMSAQSAQLCKYARAMWTLMQQPLAATTEAKPYRALRRRLEKEGHPPAPVVVVKLRRRLTQTSNGEGNPVDWSHRWVVRGHWRNQWHPRLQQHRATWISEHVKGPEDKPLVVKDKAILWKQ